MLFLLVTFNKLLLLLAIPLSDLISVFAARVTGSTEAFERMHLTQMEARNESPIPPLH